MIRKKHITTLFLHLIIFSFNFLPSNTTTNYMLLTNFDFTFALIDTVVANYHRIFQSYDFTVVDMNAFQTNTNTKTNKNFIQIFFEDEHNLVYSPSEIEAMSLFSKGLLHLQEYQQADIIIEYSQPNIQNIVSSQIIPSNLMEKIVYIPPMPYLYFREEQEEEEDIPLSLPNNSAKGSSDVDETIQFQSTNRTLPIVTTIIRLFGRRVEILQEFMEANVTIVNFSNLYTEMELEKVLSNTKVLLNLHQRDYYHTAEEFRLLPALLRGCVIISEDVPLKDMIPYHEYIIWVEDRSQLIPIVKEVTENYEYYFEMIHGKSSNLLQILSQMRQRAYDQMKERLFTIIEKRNRFDE